MLFVFFGFVGFCFWFDLCFLFVLCVFCVFCLILFFGSFVCFWFVLIFTLFILDVVLFVSCKMVGVICWQVACVVPKVKLHLSY